MSSKTPANRAILLARSSVRQREIGIRRALGATHRDVLRLVLGQGARLAAAGVVLGVAGAAIATRALGSLLYGVGPRDPATFVLLSGVLSAVALAACCAPARRATRVDPIRALREE
jgi:putative ABC transport system permease protein